MRNHLTIAIKSAIRNFQKNWQYGSLNILGLGIAFGVLILSATFLYQETTYESFHQNAERIYRPIYSFNNQAGYEVEFARIPVDFINELPNEIPEVEQIIRFQNQEQKYLRIEEERFKPKHAYITDANVFEVFSLPLLRGNQETALSKPKSVVLSAKAANKYFATTDVIGKELMVSGDYSIEEESYKITGVMQDLPVNTHLPIDLLFSFNNPEERTGWAYVYALLQEGVHIESVASKMTNFISKYNESGLMSFPFQALGDIHLQSNLAREIKPNGQWLYVKIFFWVGLFVWLIALVNFANLTTALAMSRGKEIGVRKVLGATKGNLVFFSYVETIIYSLMSLCLGGLIAASIFPSFSHLTGIQMLPPISIFLPTLILIAVLTGLIAGTMPAVLASSVKLLQIMKQGNNWSMQKGTKGIHLKRGMIALQFCVTIILLASALVAHQQFKYINNKNLGLSSEQILTIPNVPSNVTEQYLTFKNRLQGIAGIQNVSACMQVPSSEIRDVGPVSIHGQDQPEDQLPMMDMQIIDPDFMEMMEIELLDGEDFTANKSLAAMPVYSEEFTPQQYLANTPRKYLINETAMKQLGWNTPSEAIGEQINWRIGNFELAYGPITGIIKDYHQETLRNKVDPLLLTVEPIWLSNILIKVETQQLEQTMQAIENIWNDLFPYSLEYAFMDDLFNQLYQQDRVQLQLLSILSIIAIVISFLGLMSLVAYALKTRAKELAIRRIIGAKLSNLTLLIGKEYGWMLIIATSIGIPLSYQFVSDWLSHFAYRIEISPLIYMISTFLIFGLLIGTIYLQTFRATIENPVEKLREE